MLKARGGVCGVCGGSSRLSSDLLGALAHVRARVCGACSCLHVCREFFASIRGCPCHMVTAHVDEVISQSTDGSMT